MKRNSGRVDTPAAVAAGRANQAPDEASCPDGRGFAAVSGARRHIAYITTEGDRDYLNILTGDRRFFQFELDEAGLSRLSREASATLHSVLRRNGWIPRRGLAKL